MVKYEYLPLSASDRNAEGSDQIQYSPGQPGADSGNDAQAQLPSDRQPVLPNEGGVSSENSGTQAEDALILQETVSVPQPKSDAPAVPLPALFGGVLAALLAGVVIGKLVSSRKAGRKPAQSSNAAVCGYGVLHQQGQRDSQQDAFCVTGQEPSGILAAVADGMGGLVNSGEVSQLLADALTDGFAPDPQISLVRQLQLTVQQAIEKVDAALQSCPSRGGSTLVACLVQNGELAWLSIGDSRIYLWRNGGLIQLNREHNFFHDLTLLALQGDLTFEEADADPRRENLTSYIGWGFPRSIEWNEDPVSLLPGDQILLVSDGVYRALSQDELTNCLYKGTAQESVQSMHTLIQKKDFPNQDNYTGIVLKIG